MGSLVVISSVLSRLRESLIEEAITALRLTEQVSNLVSNLEYIQSSYTIDADEQIRKLVAEIRDLCCEVEDVLDDYTLEVESSRRRKRRSVSSFKGVVKRCIRNIDAGEAEGRRRRRQQKVAAEVATLIEKIDHLTQSLRSLSARSVTENIENLMAAFRNVQLGRLLEQEEIVDIMSDDFNTISSLLVKESEIQVPVIAIYGVRGSGKTTLARRIYNSPKIKGYFEGFAWVTVSETYRITSVVLGDTLAQLVPELSKEISQFEDISLAEKLFQVLQSKKCLIVLDDVWSSQVWETLRFALAYHKSDSKVLVTTRDLDLARRIYPYEMRRLTQHEAWHLFMTKVLSPSYQIIRFTEETTKMLSDIVTKCRGLPLLLVTLANFLASKSFSEWKIVHENIESFLKRGEGSGMMEVLSVSYNELPYNVKPCFSYLAIFPENSEIEAETLYLLWMAEGIIPLGQGEETVTEIGKRCLAELASRSMVDDIQLDEVGKFKCCSLRNIKHQFCLSKEKDSSFFEVMDLRRHSNMINPSEAYRFPSRRLALYLDHHEEDGYPDDLKEKISSVMETVDHLRSLLFINADQHDQQYIFCPESEELFNFEHFKLLRVLGFHGCTFQTRKLPKGIEKLLHLRYLSFRGCYLKELQSYIGNLSYLQTLDLRVTISCKMTIPDILCKLERLMHLYLPVAFQAAKGVDKLSFAGLRELQILKNFDTRVCHVQHLLQLPNIRILDATTSGSNEDLEVMIDFIRKTSANMRELTLDVRNFDCYSSKRQAIITDLFSCSGFHSLSIDGYIEKLPHITCPGLTKLSFRGSQLVADPMPTLGKLPNLWVLVLSEAAFVGKDMVVICSWSTFPNLRQLQLSGLHNLENLTIEISKCNLTLRIERCKSLKVPQGLSVKAHNRKLTIYCKDADKVQLEEIKSFEGTMVL